MKHYLEQRITESQDRAMRRIAKVWTRLVATADASDAELRLIGGELTAQEIRAVRAFVAYIMGGNSQ